MTGTPEVVTGTPVVIDTKDTVIDASRYVISETKKDNVYTTNRKPKSAPREINYERWNEVTGEISRDVLRLIPPGVNYERLLDKCEANGWSLSRLRERLGAINFENAGKCGGLLEHVLRDLAGEPTPRKPDDKPAWCERDGCDPITRTWLEDSQRLDGTFTNNCREMNDFLNDSGKCHRTRNGIKETNAET